MSVFDRSPEELWVCDLGTVPYGDALALQEEVRARRQAGEVPDTLLLLEHPAVYTLGRRAGEGELPFTEAFYRARGIEVHRCDRGGRITYHGPGQLVGYPIMQIDDVIGYVRALEATIVATLAGAGVRAHARPQDGPDYTGVWVEDRKIASIGVHVQRGVSTHGLAVNLSNDLEPFQWVVACGLPGVQMTSLAQELERLPVGGSAAGDSAAGLPSGGLAADAGFRERLIDSFCEVFGRAPRRVGAEQLHDAAGSALGAAEVLA